MLSLNSAGRGLRCTQDVKDMPEPLSGEVTSSRQPGGLWAARSFTGIADTKRSKEEADKLCEALRRDNLSTANEEWALARYNDPSTKPWFRRNEVLVPVEGFDLWNT